MPDLEVDLNLAEQKAWRALGDSKFMVFGYWATTWAHLNQIGNFGRRNPFAPVAVLAQEMDLPAKPGK